ncbi:MAG: hypothetical protein JWN14_482, partial [Chthonomonadales bacterium]|nr:hypothetical protein [Chthonomonadales bacterium]
MQGWRSMVALALVMGLVGVEGTGQAQALPQAPTPPLPRFEYDVALKGPLLMVIGGRFASPGYHLLPPEQRDALTARIDASSQRIVVGGLTVVAPQTMQVIETKPGKANPYADLTAEERLKVLLSYFDAAQWTQAGSAQGIGLADMSEIEQALYLSLLPEQIAAQHIKIVQGDQPGLLHYIPQNDPQECDPLDVRLRLVRKVLLLFSKKNTNEFGYVSHIPLEAGDVITQFTKGGSPRGDRKPASETVLVFGVPIIRVVPNHLKPGDLDFTDPKLRQPIALDGELKTLGDLLKR